MNKNFIFRKSGAWQKMICMLCILSCTPFVVFAQQRVSGTVIDAAGASFAGVNIVEKGVVSSGTITDANGNFTLNVQSGATLVVSFIGYVTQEIVVGTRSELRITLIEDSQALEEVVVVGYGTQRKSDLTSAIAKVSGDVLEARPVARVDQALQGQLAGVHVQQSGGKPGKKAVIRVRGVNSISAGNDPLYVVDGFPVDAETFSNMSLSDIESVEVLKDAASASIYGSRGAGGVVIISTKRGIKGKELKVELDAYHGYSKIDRYIEFMSAAEHLDMIADARDDAFARTGGDLSLLPMERPYSYRYNQDWVNTARTNPGALKTYNPVAALLRIGMEQNYQLSLSGSTKSARYMVSANYFRQQGIVKNTDYTRYSFRANVDVDVKKWLTVGFNLAPAYIVDHDKDTEGKQTAINDAETSAQFIDPRTGIWGESELFSDFPVSAVTYNSIAKIENLKDEKNRGQILVDMYAQLNLWKGLTFKSSFGAVYINYRRDRFLNQVMARTGQPSGEYWGDQSLNILNENILNFKYTFAGKHSVHAMAGFTVQHQKDKSAYLSGTNFPNDLVPTLNAAGSWSGRTDMSEHALLSYLGRINYAFADKYLLSASIRSDGSSRFGTNTKWGIFPAISAGWRIDQEGFMSDIKQINRLKLRANWGKTGNNSIGNYASIPTMGNNYYLAGMSESRVIGMRPANIANPDLSWEQTITLDVGADIGLWNNRLSLSIDYYNSITTGMLLSVPIPTITGFGSEMQNIGELENKGWEFEINSVNISRKDFQWETSLNLSFNKNKVLKLGPGDAPIYSGDWFDQVCITAVGHPVGSFYVYKQLGVYKNQAEVDADPSRRPNSRPGDVIIEDYNKDGQISPDDRQIFGSNQPKYIFGFTNRFKYKGFDLSIFFNGAGGNQIFHSVGRWTTIPSNSSFPHLKDWANRWRSEQNPGDGTTPRISDAPTGANNEYSNRYIFDGSYVRLKNITLGYVLPESLINRIGLSNLRVYASMDNVYIWDHYYAGYTPEVDFSNGSAVQGGRDYGTYPATRTILFGINVTF
jgi:TonB-linked SusC/RagA family outer membrane protein